ncbi:HGGxSTG domain-containing protein [Streptomyces sp. CB03911]|uniref:HGGxSTG domain-containing protein n=1 Tax=Streptomyces sp. CB03911 TaxID=1804758 RepID=UPI00093CE8F8|nr:HGGxSTG domain-containing protein [Streptomyces sp. CB03911]
MHQAEQPGPHAPDSCGARRRDGQPCTNPPMRGADRCRMHGGAAPQVRAAAGRRIATAEWARSFGEPAEDADPTATVLNEIRWCAGHVNWLRARVQDLEPEALVWGTVSEVDRRGGQYPGVDITSAAKASTWVALYGTERDRLVRMCEVAHRMGISERQIELAERLGQVVADLLRDILAELQLTDLQQQTAALAVPRHLRALAGELTGEGA